MPMVPCGGSQVNSRKCTMCYKLLPCTGNVATAGATNSEEARAHGLCSHVLSMQQDAICNAAMLTWSGSDSGPNLVERREKTTLSNVFKEKLMVNLSFLLA